MESKKLIGLFTIIGSMVGGFIPMLWGDSGFSATSMLFGGLGAIAGIYFGYKIGQ